MDSLIDQLPIHAIIGTVILLATIYLVRVLVQRSMTPQDEVLSETQRRIISNIKTATFFIGLFGLVLIWAPALRTFALSVTAFAVAIVVATKELILCFSGALLRTTTSAFSVGDWVEAGGIRGEVVDQNIFAVTIQEIYSDGPHHEYTGRTAVIPNSIFLTTPIKNENFFNRYVFHSFEIVLPKEADPFEVERLMLQTIQQEMTPHIDLAKRYNTLIKKRARVGIMDTTPRVRMASTKDGDVKITVTAFLPTKQALQIEQSAMRKALQYIWDRGKGDRPAEPGRVPAESAAK